MQENHEVRAYINWLEKKVRILEQRIDGIEDKIAEHPSFVKPERHNSNGGKTGRPKGHEGVTRPLPKPEDVDETIELNTDRCPCCGEELTGMPVETNERYVEDIEPAKPLRRKYVIRRKWCPHCKKLVSEKPKDVIPKCRLGLNLLLYVAFWKYLMAMPVNKICTMLECQYGFHVSEATVINELNLLADAFGNDFGRIIGGMKNERYVHGDETGHRIKGENYWLWAFITKTKALYIVRKTRGSSVPKEVLGENFSGVLHSDFWDAYNWVKNQQKCWGHILRKTGEMEEDCLLHRKLKRLYRKAKKLRESSIGLEEKTALVDGLEKEIESLKLIPFCTKEADAFVRTLTKHKHNLFRFVTDINIEPTNNTAERAIRPAVVMRKISGGSRSERGAKTFETNMTVMQTWKLQNKDFFEEGMKRLMEFSHG